MSRSSHPLLIRFAAALIALQALWSGLAATAYAAGIDDAKYLCATVALDAEARAQIADLMKATGLDQADEREPVYDPGDCPACSLSKPVVLANADPVMSQARVQRGVRAHKRVDQVSPRQPAGPPVGLRAPPVQI